MQHPRGRDDDLAVHMWLYDECLHAPRPRGYQDLGFVGPGFEILERPVAVHRMVEGLAQSAATAATKGGDALEQQVCGGEATLRSAVTVTAPTPVVAGVGS